MVLVCISIAWKVYTWWSVKCLYKQVVFIYRWSFEQVWLHCNQFGKSLYWKLLGYTSTLPKWYWIMNKEVLQRQPPLPTPCLLHPHTRFVAVEVEGPITSSSVPFNSRELRRKGKARDHKLEITLVRFVLYMYFRHPTNGLKVSLEAFTTCHTYSISFPNTSVCK